MENQANYHHVSKRDLEEMCSVGSDLTEFWYLESNKTVSNKIKKDCELVEKKYFMIPELKYLSETIMKLYNIKFDNSELKDKYNQDEDFYHIPLEKMRDMVNVTTSLLLYKSENQKNKSLIKYAKENYSEFKVINDLIKSFD